MIHIGIDPGLNGAVGVLGEKPEIELVDAGGAGCSRETGRMLPTYDVFDTPTLTVAGEKNKRMYNVAAMAALLKPYAILRERSGYDVLVVLESVHSMPKQGVASSFSFGRGLGIWEGIIAALGLPLEMPSPQRWKKEMLADQGKDKDASRYKAIQLYPSLANKLGLVKHDGRAEALLMAGYGQRLRRG